MRRSIRNAWLSTAMLAFTAASPALAQGPLPGVVAAGRYGEGSLPAVRQPAPDPPAAGAVYGVGPWPTYTPPLADGPGRDLVIGACSICHSTTYITMQPPLPPAAWAGTVDKMIKVFGASISDDVARQVTEYLKAHYTPETRR
jgi:hypothetical protein